MDQKSIPSVEARPGTAVRATEVVEEFHRPRTATVDWSHSQQAYLVTVGAPAEYSQSEEPLPAWPVPEIHADEVRVDGDPLMLIFEREREYSQPREVRVTHGDEVVVELAIDSPLDE